MNPTEWKTARNQAELDALFSQYGEALKVRMVGEWEGDLRIACRALHSLDLSGARIRGTVNAKLLHLGGDLRACGAQVDGAVIFDYARIIGGMDFREALIYGSMSAYKIEVGKAMSACGVRVGALCIYDARIVGTVDAGWAHIMGELDTGYALIGGALIICNALVNAGVGAHGTQVGGDVDARRADIHGSIRADHARIGGALRADGATVCGALLLDDSHIGGALTYRGSQIRGGIVMPEVMHGVHGRAIAQCDGYILWLGDDGRYRAGCRVPLTRDEALKHWGRRKDERARVFLEAIQEASREAIARESSAQQAG